MSERQAIAERPSTLERQSITRFVRYEHLLAGVSGGVTSTLVLHPLDLIKIRLQGKMQWKTSYIWYGFVGFSFLSLKKKNSPVLRIIAYYYNCLVTLEFTEKWKKKKILWIIVSMIIQLTKLNYFTGQQQMRCKYMTFEHSYKHLTIFWIVC